MGKFIVARSASRSSGKSSFLRASRDAAASRFSKVRVLYAMCRFWSARGSGGALHVRAEGLDFVDVTKDKG